jgi:hypothetical protein
MKYVREAKYNFKSNFMPFHLKKYTKLSIYNINANLDRKKQSKFLKEAFFESGFLQYIQCT